MDGLTSWMEKYILPLAAKIGAQKHLVALRDAFIGTMPATMAGSIAVMINAIIRDLPPSFGLVMMQVQFQLYVKLLVLMGFVWNGTLAVAGLVLLFLGGIT